MQHTAVTGLLKESRGTLQLMVGQPRAAARGSVDGSEQLKVLCCSANVGNAEIKELGSWIPPGGIIPGSGNFSVILDQACMHFGPLDHPMHAV